jgi:hypothetical protein
VLRGARAKITHNKVVLRTGYKTASGFRGDRARKNDSH